MIEGEGRYKHVGVDVPQWEEVSAEYRTLHPGASTDAAKVLNHVLNLYVEGVLAVEEEVDFWGEAPRVSGGKRPRNINVYRETLALAVAAYRERHETPWGSNAGIVRYVLGLYVAKVRKGMGDGSPEIPDKRPGWTTGTPERPTLH